MLNGNGSSQWPRGAGRCSIRWWKVKKQNKNPEKKLMLHLYLQKHTRQRMEDWTLVGKPVRWRCNRNWIPTSSNFHAVARLGKPSATRHPIELRSAGNLISKAYYPLLGIVVFIACFGCVWQWQNSVRCRRLYNKLSHGTKGPWRGARNLLVARLRRQTVEEYHWFSLGIRNILRKATSRAPWRTV